MRHVPHPLVTMNPCQSKPILTHSANQALDRPDLSPRARENCLRSLYKMCGRHGFLPTSLKIPLSCERNGDALYRGGFADVWKGEHGGRDVAVKVMRIYSNSDLQKVIRVSFWLCSPTTHLRTYSGLYRGSARRLLRGKPSGIRMSCR